VYKYFKDLVHIGCRCEDTPGSNMVTDPTQLPDLSKDEEKAIYEKNI
jgi:hypothetical protein